MKNKEYNTLEKSCKIDTLKYTNTWPLTYLAWYRHFNKKKGDPGGSMS